MPLTINPPVAPENPSPAADPNTHTTPSQTAPTASIPTDASLPKPGDISKPGNGIQGSSTPGKDPVSSDPSTTRPGASPTSQSSNPLNASSGLPRIPGETHSGNSGDPTNQRTISAHVHERKIEVGEVLRKETPGEVRIDAQQVETRATTRDVVTSDKPEVKGVDQQGNTTRTVSVTASDVTIKVKSADAPKVVDAPPLDGKGSSPSSELKVTTTIAPPAGKIIEVAPDQKGALPRTAEGVASPQDGKLIGGSVDSSPSPAIALKAGANPVVDQTKADGLIKSDPKFSVPSSDIRISPPQSEPLQVADPKRMVSDAVSPPADVKGKSTSVPVTAPPARSVESVPENKKSPTATVPPTSTPDKGVTKNGETPKRGATPEPRSEPVTNSTRTAKAPATRSPTPAPVEVKSREGPKQDLRGKQPIGRDELKREGRSDAIKNTTRTLESELKGREKPVSGSPRAEERVATGKGGDRSDRLSKGETVREKIIAERLKDRAQEGGMPTGQRARVADVTGRESLVLTRSTSGGGEEAPRKIILPESLKQVLEKAANVISQATHILQGLESSDLQRFVSSETLANIKGIIQELVRSTLPLSSDPEALTPERLESLRSRIQQLLSQAKDELLTLDVSGDGLEELIEILEDLNQLEALEELLLEELLSLEEPATFDEVLTEEEIIVIDDERFEETIAEKVHSVSGRVVKGKDHQPMMGIIVYGGLLGIKRTDHNGEFAFVNIPEGTLVTLGLDPDLGVVAPPVFQVTVTADERVVFVVQPGQ